MINGIGPIVRQCNTIDNGFSQSYRHCIDIDTLMIRHFIALLTYQIDNNTVSD
jgi:hypothetical protein